LAVFSNTDWSPPLNWRRIGVFDDDVE